LDTNPLSLSVPEIIRDKGYVCEEHLLVTSDDFEIQLFRIPHGVTTKKGGPPVLLSHGVIDAAGSWVTNLPHQSLSYILADAGYDVWLGNSRGNKFTKRIHTGAYNASHDWNFSFDQQAKHDVPETVDFILEKTGYQSLSIVGHSQGCTQTFAAFYFQKDLAKKINFFFALAPALYFKHNTCTLLSLVSNLRVAELLDTLGVHRFMPVTKEELEGICLAFASSPKDADYLLGLLMGSNPGELNYERFGVMVHNFLGMTSVQNMVHWAQMVRHNGFRLYSYHFGNAIKYGHPDPPRYDISGNYPKEVPIAIWYGGADLMVNPKDAEKIIADLPVPPVFTKMIPEYSHVDFHLGTTAHEKIYVDLLRLLKDRVPVPMTEEASE